MSDFQSIEEVVRPMPGKARRALCLHVSCAVLAAAMIATTPAHAQGTEAADEESASDIVVTGSRVIKDGFEAPTPVSVLSTDELARMAPTSLSEALNKLPVFKNSAQPEAFVGGSGGQSFVNLRSLGPERVLVLLDGRRIVPSTANGTTDINLIPEAVVRRVDVVTGGASAGYGSDAVAGMVNFVLDTDFRGVRGRVQGGMTEGDYGDNYKLSLSAGFGLGDRGSLVISGQYYQNQGVTAFKNLPWFNSCSLIANPTGTPVNTSACDVRSTAFTTGGVVNTGPLRGIEFGPGGVPRQFQYGSLVTSQTMVGGGGVDNGANFFAIPRAERYTTFAHLKYDLTDNVTGFGEFLYGQTKSKYNFTASWQGQGTEYRIQRDNVFLPASVRQQMVTAGVQEFLLTRYSDDFGFLVNNVRNRTWRATAGLDVKLGGWTVSAYYSHGENKYDLALENNAYANRLYNAADAVAGPNGQPICRSTLTQPNNGCVPLNVFGAGSPSAAAIDWVTGTTRQFVHVKQDVAEITAAGDLVNLWAGPLSVAVGAGYRRESSDQTVDETSTAFRQFTGGYLGWPAQFNGQLGAWERTNPQPLGGKYNAKEVFGEALLPLLRDSAIGYTADLNGAIRYTDYSTSGGVTTWKIGMTYEPIPDIRFRATRSRDIRAPNLTELYTGPSSSQGTLIDRFQPTTSPAYRPVVNTLSVGNPLLKPEKANTTTIGVVFKPRAFPGFTASVDYFDITIKDAIGTIGGQVTIDQCFGGATDLCPLLRRGPDGVLNAVQTPFLNIAERSTRGVDIEVGYRTGLGNGTVSARALATYVSKLATKFPGAATLDVAGQTGPGRGGVPNLGVPHWTVNLDLGYEGPDWSINTVHRFLGAGILDVNNTPAFLDPSLNHVKAAFYTDLTVTKKFDILGAETEFYLTITNLFNKAPPPAPRTYFVFGTYYGGTNPALFDLLGRQYTAGIKFNF